MAPSRLCIASASLRWKKERGKSLFGLKRLLCCCFLIERKCTLLLFTEDEDVDGCICEEIKAPWGMAGVDVAADMMEGGTVAHWYAYGYVTCLFRPAFRRLNEATCPSRYLRSLQGRLPSSTATAKLPFMIIARSPREKLIFNRIFVAGFGRTVVCRKVYEIARLWKT